ncbi:MAG: hypothetical protein HFF13_00175 [Angelakisella sp.]|nr:hypothetical protein [Angelakisella sp.]
MTIRELLEKSHLPEEAGTLLEPGRLPLEEEGRILALALAKAGLPPVERKEKQTMKRGKFGLMLLAGVLCAGAVVASAAGYFTLNRPLAKHLGAGEQENGLVSQAVQNLDSTCTVDGWTVTASQVLGDKTQLRVLLDVTAPEGTVLPNGDYRLELPILDPDVIFTVDKVEDDEPTDNKMSFVLSSVQAKDYRGQTVKFHMEGISRYKKYTLEELNAGANPLDVDRLVAGDFDLTFQLNYQDTSVTYNPGAEIDTAYGKIQVDEITLSPLSIFIKLSGEGTIIEPGTRLVFDGEVSAFEVDDKGNIIKVEPKEGAEGDQYVFNGDEESSSMSIFHDGSTLQSQYGIAVQVVDKEGNVIPYRTGDTQPDSVTMTFAGIIDPNEVAAIIINDVEVPLAK